MKIKLHNSMEKMDHSSRRVYLFDEKIKIIVFTDGIGLTYQIDDFHYFLNFYPDTKKLEEGIGFGKDHRNPNSEWWKDSCYQWKEI